MVKAYRVDFKFTVEDQASMYVIAKNEAEAAEGCLMMLSQNEQTYQSPEVTKVEEYKKPEADGSETIPRLN